ncbi:uncharacterized protein [Aquarana catesbeiana]|uniref:uncharacterized protein n=1 Tax=Aquarana catesbeiana TaxID=8400 RepID=UPI003CC97840
MRLSSMVPTVNAAASPFITKDELFSALAGLEHSIAGMIASILQGDKKRDRSPSPEPPSLEQEWVGYKEELKAQDSVAGLTGESASEQSGQEDIQLVSASQSQGLLIQTLTEMVCSAFKLPLAEFTEPPWSSLGSLRHLQAAQAFPLHPLLEQAVYADWEHPDRIFVPPKRFSLLYPMDEKFIKKWSMPAIDAAVSSLNKNLTCPVDKAQGLKDPVDKKLESLLKASFSLASSAIQPAVAAIGICQSIKDQVRQPDRPNQEDDLAENNTDIPRALYFAVDALLKNSIQQVSRFGSLVFTYVQSFVA